MLLGVGLGSASTATSFIGLYLTVDFLASGGYDLYKAIRYGEPSGPNQQLATIGIEVFDAAYRYFIKR
jgi:hypothetical protein